MEEVSRSKGAAPPGATCDSRSDSEMTRDDEPPKEVAVESSTMEVVPDESTETRAERLLTSLGLAVEKYKLYYDEDVRSAIERMAGKDMDDLLGANGYVDKNVNFKHPISCTRVEIRERVDVCARAFVAFIRTYKQFQDNKRFPPVWTSIGDFSVLSFGAYELYFWRKPFGLKEVLYHNVESGH